MPRNAIAQPDLWSAELQLERLFRRQAQERLIQAWSLALLLGTVLYVLIGHSPWRHGIDVDPDTGAVGVSAVNRWIWIGLALMAAPLLWARRERLAGALKRIWPLFGLYAWFALTTRWALDPAASSRRLFLYVVALVISLAVALGFGSSRRLHRAFAIACALLVGIDLASWIVAPGVSMTDIGLAAIHNHKNTLGAAMLFAGLMVGPYVFTQSTPRGRIFWGLVFAGAVALLIASRSKTSEAILAACLALMPLVLLVLRVRVQALRAICAGLAMLLAAAALLWLAWCAVNAVDPLSPLQGVTLSKRTDVWAFVVGEIAKRPIKGSGFGSFWDIDPTVQPSIASGLWFTQGDAFTNEAHNGYLDLMVTTGLVGLSGALFVLLRWVGRGLGYLRRTLRSADPAVRLERPTAVSLGLFPLIIFSHNFTESSYFTANAIFGTLILLVGVDLDLNRRAAAPDA